MIRISVKKHGAYVCGPCLRARPEAKERHAASMSSLRRPVTVVCRCSDCGTERELPKNTARYHGRRVDGSYDWRCVPCGSRVGAPKRAALRTPVPKRVEMACACGNRREIARSKWLLKWRGNESAWKCGSCAAKAAYADGRNRGTKGMRFLPKTQRETMAEPMALTCPTCSEVRTVTFETWLRSQNAGFAWSPWRDVDRTAERFSTCPKCASVEMGLGMRLTPEQFVERAHRTHGDSFDYSATRYTIGLEPVTIGCPAHGPFTIRAANHLNGQGCPKCSMYITKPMWEIAEFLDAQGIAYEFNDRTVIAPLEIDLWIPSKRFGIEFHGLWWHREDLVGRTAHQDKWRRAEAAGIRLVQVFEDEWRDRTEVVRRMLLHRLGASASRTPARKCVVGPVPRAEARAFVAARHVQGADAAVHYYGLRHGDQLVAVASFVRPQVTGGDRSAEWMVGRFVTEGSVPGGFGRLFQAFVRDHAPASVGTYADLRWGNGDVYAACGFAPVRTTEPNYFYFRRQEGIRYHRFGFTRAALAQRMGEAFRPEETEAQNARRAGLDRVYDAGNAYFRWDRPTGDRSAG